jgi:hypothetical protein
MNTKLLISLFTLSIISVHLHSQDTTLSKTFIADFGIGGAVSSYQDVKFSDVRYSGIGTTTRFDFKWRSKAIHNITIEGLYSSENPKTFDHGMTNVYQANIGYKYLYPVGYYSNSNLFVGAKIEAIDMTLRMNTDLYNNATYLAYGTNVKISTMYEYKLSDSWIINADLNFQLFSFMDESMSFAYSVNQHVLENGEYNYDDIVTAYIFTPFWKYLSIETNIHANYGKRWIFSYSWRMQQSYIVSNYPMTKGYSALSVGFKFISKSKISK